MEEKICSVKSDVKVSELVNKMHSYYDGGGERKKSTHILKDFVRKPMVRRISPSKYSYRNKLNFNTNPNKDNALTTYHKPIQFSNTQSDPLGLKHTLLANKYQFLNSKKKRTMNRFTRGIRVRRARICRSEPIISNNNNSYSIVDYRNNKINFLPVFNFPSSDFKEIEYGDNHATKFYSPQKEISRKKFDQNHFFKRYLTLNKNGNQKLENKRYNPFKSLKAKGDLISSEADSTFYASSSEGEYFFEKCAQFNEDINSNQARACVIPDYTMSRYLKDDDLLARHKAENMSSGSSILEKNFRLKYRTPEPRSNQKKYRIATDLKSQHGLLQPKQKNRYILKKFNTCRLPEINYDYSKSFNEDTVSLRYDNHRKVMNHLESYVHITPSEKVTDEELWKRFEIIFRKYASTRIHSGNVIPHSISTMWMRDAGVIGNLIDDQDADFSFKKEAGLKYTMNVHEYKDFLINLTIRKKLPFYEIYRRMCGL